MKDAQRTTPNCPKCNHKTSTIVNSGKCEPEMFEDSTHESELVPFVTRKCNNQECLHEFNVARVELFVLV
jgi:hypothetical protein